MVKGLPQYNYRQPSTGNGYNYDRPGTGSQESGGGKVIGGKRPSSDSDDQLSVGKSAEKYGGRDEDGVNVDEEQEPLVHKHIYVHVPPPELEEEEPVEQKKTKSGRPEKHYKIIFIKAPTQSPASLSIPVQPPKEEKTIVYVLVKKSEEAKEVTVAAPEPTEPSKPEVYFIRYKASKKEEGETKEGGEKKEDTYGGGSAGTLVTEQEESDKGETSSPPSYLPPSNRLRSSPITDYSQDYDSSY